MVSTNNASTDRRRRWRRMELIIWTIVAALALAAFVLLSLTSSETVAQG